MIKYKKFDIKKVSLFLTLIIYGIYQNYLILLGGTTWDEPASILSASKQIYKAYIFIVDPNNAVLENFVPPEDCEEYVSQSGCGDWATDYWGFGGKELFNKSKSYDQSILYFCPPHFTYSLFQETEKPWSLINGDFVFDDSYPFETDEVFYYQSDMLAHNAIYDFFISGLSIFRKCI